MPCFFFLMYFVTRTKSFNLLAKQKSEPNRQKEYIYKKTTFILTNSCFLDLYPILLPNARGHDVQLYGYLEANPLFIIRILSSYIWRLCVWFEPLNLRAE